LIDAFFLLLLFRYAIIFSALILPLLMIYASAAITLLMAYC